MPQLERLKEQLKRRGPKTCGMPLTEKERLIRVILDMPIRTDQDYLELLRLLTKPVDEREGDR